MSDMQEMYRDLKNKFRLPTTYVCTREIKSYLNNHLRFKIFAV